MSDEFLVSGLAIAAACIWALSMTLQKRGLAAGGTVLQGSLIVAVVDAVCYWTVIGGITVTTGHTPPITLFVLGIFFVSGTVGTAVGRLFSFVGIDRVGASVNSAGISTRPLFAAVLAFLAIGEVVNELTVVGMVVLVVGLVVLTLSDGGDLSGWEPWELAFPLLAAVAYGGSDVVRRFGLTETAVSPLEAVALHETWGVLWLVGILAVRVGREAIDIPRRALGVFLVAGVFNAASLFLFFQALSLGNVAVVSSLLGTAPLFVAVFTALLLGDLERVTRRLAVGAVLVVAGATLITLA
ncbi:EamA family transporter [Haloarchaeobius sp. DFWS5]|uniref:DMT family transporter n=1 Tax=Haloarchaeobius sp. DFWS5 TaxID=3446114 RepID=UPI003EBCEB61